MTLVRPARIEIFHFFPTTDSVITWIELVIGNITVLGNYLVLTCPSILKFLDWHWYNIRYYTINSSLEGCLNDIDI